MSDRDDIQPDTKDWTWVLGLPCPECGFDAQRLDIDLVPALIHDNAMSWAERLTHGGTEQRPRSTVWSPLEYACHVRDVHRLFEARVDLMLSATDPRFPNWDQDAVALEADYAHQDPIAVSADLVEAAGSVAGRYASVRGDQWLRRGVRSNGSEFTVDSLCRYHMHDVVHHLWDVDQQRREATVAAYQEDAAAFADYVWGMPASDRGDVAEFARRVKSGDVLEIGSGPGRDALAMEDRGLRVQRTDITAAFVDLMIAEGHDAHLLDPLIDDLGGPWDGVWMSAVLHHLERREVPVLLRRLHDATKRGGTLYLSTKEGDGGTWSTHGSVTAPRHFTFWRQEPLTRVLAESGWRVSGLVRRTGVRGETWLDVFALRQRG